MSPPQSSSKETTLHSVGEVAEATGISPATLRVWERRYGAPVPVRLESGHRRYTPDQMLWLRRVSEALARGHRAGDVLRATDDALTEMLSAGAAAADDQCRRWVTLALSFKGAELWDEVRRVMHGSAPEEFIDQRLAPFLEEIGREWSDGRLGVRHEHFVTQLVDDALRLYRTNLGKPERPKGLIAFTTLTGEHHGLGLQMAAVICQSVGVSYEILGVETPRADIVSAVRELGAEAVGISVSLAGGGVETDRRLVSLRAQLPASVELVVGGQGARRPRRGGRGIRYLNNMTEFSRWLLKKKWGSKP